MVYINLLPVREIKRRFKAKKQLFAALLVFLCLLALLAALAFWQTEKNNSLGQKHTALQQEKQRYDKILKEIKKLEQDKELLQTRIDVINQLQQSSSLTVHVLDEVAGITPSKRLWLTSISQTGGSVKIDGMALDNRTIAKYMDDLKGSPYITGVNLASSSLKAFAGRNLKAFSISCSVSVPEKTAPATTEKE